MHQRSDGKMIRDLDGFHSIVPYVMPKRTEAEVSSQEKFDLTELMAYMKKRNEAEGLNLKLFHAVCYAVARTVWLRPKMNIFIAGKRFWQRNEILLSFVVKRKFEDNSEESLMCLKVDPEMNLDSVSKLILGEVDTVRHESGNDLGKTMDFVGKLPRFVLQILFRVLRIFEHFGVMPKSLMRGDPNYSSVLLSNLGSIGAGAPYHHLSNYGTCSIMVTVGTLHKEDRKMPDGTEQERDMLDVTFTLDERIADGFYFAKSLKITRYLLEHPETLEQTIATPSPLEV